MKLWNKNIALDKLIEAYTVGEDPAWDMILLPYDIQASRAHCKMLKKIGILNDQEEKELLKGLDEILNEWKDGTFTIQQADEDGHTAIENALTEKIGKAGEKIHSGRSRNDQVLTALRLYMKNELGDIKVIINDLSQNLVAFIKKYGEIPLPGYTHTRKAMPASIGMWADAIVKSFQDNLVLLETIYTIIDKNPLGTGAGYGISLGLDRKMTTEELGFQSIQENPIQTQHSRTKYEGLLLTLCSNIMGDLNKMASDLIFYTIPGNDFFQLPDALTTGSSIMPQKKNPDVLELLRAKYHEITAAEWQIRQTNINLISGYHRDMQLSKPALMKSLNTLKESLEISNYLFTKLQVNV
ncbi:MAG: argininosuccinate lyase, partial [Candidatus Marinimicrobia bacterium]|nr:argininosuccinate lyase [Candidatus Neomarinimicrobiota bacterium]